MLTDSIMDFWIMIGSPWKKSGSKAHVRNNAYASIFIYDLNNTQL